LLLVILAAMSAFVPLSFVRAAEPSPAPAPAPSASSPSTAAPSASPGAATVPAIAFPTPPAGFSLPASLGAAGAPQPYLQFLKKTERQTGLIDIVRKDDDVYFDLGPQQFDRPFIVAPVLASGVGTEAFAGRVYPSFVLEFKRVGRRVLWIDKNADFSATPGSAAANALAISVTDSVINSTPVVAEDETKQHVVVSAAFFLGDFENVGADLGGRSGPIILLGLASHGGFSVDATKSYVEKSKALPKNDELLANLAFSGPAGDLSGAPDGRGVRLRMHYSIVEAPPASTYVPRLADDRVGYFITAQKRFDNDALPTPFVRYIDRWNFNNGPIVYYLTDEIPAQYKRPIRAALMQWNSAFAKIGIPNAIEVRDQPKDPTWDPDDIRYSTVRWITSGSSAWAAYGPAIEDPRTGEILRVEIVIDGESLRSIKRGYVDQVVPTRATAIGNAGLPMPGGSISLRCNDPAGCDTFDDDSAAFGAIGSFALRAAGGSPAQTERFAEDWLQMAVLHESGHNFGLRHNFVSATLYSLAQIHDRRFTRAHGLVGSVMGYTPLNLSPPGQAQGDYFQLRLGPYDYWAIRYGYAKFPNVKRPDDEKLALRGIANEGSRREYDYASDEDADGPLAIDPRVAPFELSNDPLAFDANQFAVVSDLVANLDRRYPRDDRPYYEERRTFETLMSAYERAAMLATKYVGGLYTSRDHRGQPGGHAPIRPVSRDAARRAFDLLSEHVFSSKAMHFSPQLLADLGSEHFLHRGVDSVESPDFPIEEYVAALQDNVLYAVFSPDTMSRLANDGYKVAPGTSLMTLDDLFGWTQAAVWDDLHPRLTSIDALHRGLQRRYTNLMIAFSLAPSFVISAIGYPSDTPSLARYELRRLAPRVDSALRSRPLDVATRAHLEDVQSRVHRALEPSATRGV
jgi:hypothetical protein